MHKSLRKLKEYNGPFNQAKGRLLVLHLTRKVDLFHLRGQSDQPLVVGSSKKSEGVGFMKIPKGLEDNEINAVKLQGQ